MSVDVVKCDKNTIDNKILPLLTVDGGAGVMVKPAFCVNARKSRTVAFDNDTESLPPLLILKSTTSSTSIFSISVDRNGFLIHFVIIVVVAVVTMWNTIEI